MKYRITIYWSDPDQAFIAEIPELPGCKADGKSQIAVLRNVNVIAREWIETAKAIGRRIPS
ncbi:MAG: type II toxin-antitoxin system HicB family antitoxin [Planctomycetes bacterium]|nr:type II toxin-antitoxin system HicB family antitoxin [Planctomycetota bacterium]